MIELKGVIIFRHLDHSHASVVVSIDGKPKHERHEMGIDIEVNKGRIQTYLADLYGVKPGDIVWPGHIILN